MNDDDKLLTFEEAIDLIMEETGWSRIRATRELLMAMNEGKIPFQRTQPAHQTLQ